MSYKFNLRINKRIYVIIAAVIICIAAAAVFCVKGISRNGITAAEVSKLIACADADMGGLELSGGQGYWYEPYMNYVKEKGYLDKKPKQKIKYNDVYKLADAIGAGHILENMQLDRKKNISRQEFLDIYINLLDYFTFGNEVKFIEAGIIGTPANMKGKSDGEAHTTEGIFRFTGIVLDDKIDHTVRLVVRGDEILSVAEVVEYSVTYKNIWIKEQDEGSIHTNVYGVERTFAMKGVNETVEQVLSDIEIVKGKVIRVDVKDDTISGKVQSVSDKYIELEGYGRVEVDDYFMIYDISREFSIKSYRDIVIGYSLQDFVVAEGKICGAVISKKLEAENIRVIIKTNGFKDVFHETVSITSDSGYTVSSTAGTQAFSAAEVLELNKDSELLKNGRVTIIPENGGETKILTVKRSQGAPSYEGKIEIAATDSGLVIVNDVDIEDYLKRVVPSEMPASFSREALKVQAVCARSYAYKQLTNDYYGVYGAHVDDSTQYQVYNNTVEYNSSNEAIEQTRGLVLTYNDEVVQTYYYSTSCGMTTDVSVWGSSADGYPYFKSVAVSRTANSADLTDESEFEKFITAKNEQDYDCSYELYRWEMNDNIEHLSSSFNAKLHDKWAAAPKKILTLQADGQFVSEEISTVGTITEIKVNQRAPGGAIRSLIVSGTENTVRIESESYIRALFGMADVEMTTNTGTTKMSSMPSAFCIFKPVYENGTLTGYRIIGGGYGHGIGMSQNGANSMAKSGMDYKQILELFYPGTKLGN